MTRGGTYLAMEGPQFSTRAESLLYRAWGADVIGMTAMPEAKLAREAELPYALLGMVTGIGGGVLRDVLAGRVPVIFEGVIYATPALAGAVVAVEIKRRGEIDGVEQLTRYLELMNRDPLLAPVAGVYAAQQIKPQARTLAEDRGIRCVVVDYDALRGTPTTDLRLF